MKGLKESFILLAGALILGAITTHAVSPYIQTIVALCGINIILSSSLNLVNGFTGQFSLGHAGFMAVGAYTSAAFSTLLVPALFPDLMVHEFWSQIFFIVALLIGAVAAGFVGFLVGVPSLRLRGDYLAIVTLGFGEIIRIGILNVESIGGARGLIGIPQWSTMYWVWIVAAFSVYKLARLLWSVPGRQFMAVRDDETATSAMGLSTTKIKVRSFVISSGLAGVAGVLFAHYYAYLNPATFTFSYSFQILAMVVLGGLGSLSGSVIAAILLTGLLEVLRPLQDLTGVDLRMVIYALVLVVLMLTRPQGLFGHCEIKPFWKVRKS